MYPMAVMARKHVQAAGYALETGLQVDVDIEAHAACLSM